MRRLRLKGEVNVQQIMQMLISAQPSKLTRIRMREEQSYKPRKTGKGTTKWEMTVEFRKMRMDGHTAVDLGLGFLLCAECLQGGQPIRSTGAGCTAERWKIQELEVPGASGGRHVGVMLKEEGRWKVHARGGFLLPSSGPY